jgi:cyclophilin family peptidyl-prolyl cis-trans isomerase
MKNTKNLKKILARGICAGICAVMFISMLSMSGCSRNKVTQGNIGIIEDLQPGDTYAIIKLQGFDGEMTFILFDEIAPIGVEKFTDAANSGYYDGKTFHRVLEDMLVQGGALNMDGSDATIPAEEMFEIELHENARSFPGALAFATDEKTGMNYRQFFIVTANEPVDIDEEADNLKEILSKASEDALTSEQRGHYMNLQSHLSKLPKIVKERYSERGGLHLLDGRVTVFGQLITGHDLLAEIQKAEVVAGNRIDDNNDALRNGKGQHSRPADPIFIETIRIIRIPTEEELLAEEEENG